MNFINQKGKSCATDWKSFIFVKTIDEEDMEYPAVWFTAAFLFAIGEKRTKGLRIRANEIRPEIESKVSLLRETRFNDYAADLKILCEKLPNT